MQPLSRGVTLHRVHRVPQVHSGLFNFQRSFWIAAIPPFLARHSDWDALYILTGCCSETGICYFLCCAAYSSISHTSMPSSVTVTHPTRVRGARQLHAHLSHAKNNDDGCVSGGLAYLARSCSTQLHRSRIKLQERLRWQTIIGRARALTHQPSAHE